MKQLSFQNGNGTHIISGNVIESKNLFISIRTYRIAPLSLEKFEGIIISYEKLNVNKNITFRVE